MSQTTTYESIDAYINALYAPEDEVLAWIQAETQRAELPAISIRPFEGRLLQFLAQMIGAKTIVEIGTLAGYSGTWMARGLPAEGKLITVDASSKHLDVARQSFERAGLSERVELVQGNAIEVLPKLSERGPFDMVFIDADKDSYLAYLDWAIDNVRTGGLITAHNALRGGRIIAPESDADQLVQTFNQRIAEDPQLNGMLIGVGDGIAAALKR